MKPESPLSADTQPNAGLSEFALPGRMRELAARILWALFKPLREHLAQIENAAKDEQAASELKLEEEVDKLANTFANAKEVLSAERAVIASRERSEVSPIDRELSRYTEAKTTIARQGENLRNQFKSRELAIPSAGSRVGVGADSEPTSKAVDECVLAASGQYDILQRAFNGPILSDFQRKKGVLRQWQWIFGIFLCLFALLLVSCVVAKNPPVALTVLIAIGLGIVGWGAWSDLKRNNIAQDSFFFGISLAVNEVQRGFKEFATLAALAEAGLPKLIASLQQEKAAKTSGFDAQRKQAESGVRAKASADSFRRECR